MNIRSIVIAAALALGFGTFGLAQTIPDAPDRPAFGLVGITRGQSARVNVSISNPDLRPGELAAGPCHVTLGFVNERNQPFTLGTRTDSGIDADGVVNPGGSLSLEIHSSDVFTAGGGGRKLLRPVVVAANVPDSPDLPAGPCRGFASTLEVLDSVAGATTVLYAPTNGLTVPDSPDQVPDNPDRAGFGVVGVVRGQSAELHAFISNPDLRPGAASLDNTPSCQVNLGFVDEIGAPVLDRRGSRAGANGVLAPGASLTLNLGPADLFRAGDAKRRGIRAVVTGEIIPDSPDLPAGPCRGLVPTFEIVDGAGQTTILYFKQ